MGYCSSFRTVTGSEAATTDQALKDVSRTDAFGSPTISNYPTGLQTVKGYDLSTGRLTSIRTGTVVPSSPGGVQDLEYQWRSNSSLYKRIDHRNTTTTSDDYTDTFSYDNMERVTVQATTVGASRPLAFGYELYGNITTYDAASGNDAPLTLTQCNEYACAGSHVTMPCQ